MILLQRGVPEQYQHVAHANNFYQTRVILKGNVTRSSQRIEQRYAEECDHLFMVGRLVALKKVPCAGNITVVAGHRSASVTGCMHFWNTPVGLILDELDDLLKIASERYCDNHPKAMSFISATFEPLPLVVFKGQEPPLLR